MIKEYTFIYSSGSIDALENLIIEMSKVFNLDISIDDLFYYGVFCKESVYACFSDWVSAPDFLDVPLKLSDNAQPLDEKIDYVQKVINSILVGDIEKPDWMTYVEEEETLDYYEHAPSTYLYLVAKDIEYEDFAEALVNFLYSTNMVSIYLKS